MKLEPFQFTSLSELWVQLDKNPSVTMLDAVQHCKIDKYQIVDRADCPGQPRHAL